MSKVKVVVVGCDSFSHAGKCHKRGEVFEINSVAFLPNEKAGLIEKHDPEKHGKKKAEKKNFKPDPKAPKAA